MDIMDIMCRQPDFMTQSRDYLTDKLWEETDGMEPNPFEMIIALPLWYLNRSVYTIFNPRDFLKLMAWGPYVAPFEWLIFVSGLCWVGTRPQIRAMKRRDWIIAVSYWIVAVVALSLIECTSYGQRTVDAINAALAPWVGLLPSLRFSCVVGWRILQTVAWLIMYWKLGGALLRFGSRICRLVYNDLKNPPLDDRVAGQRRAAREPPVQQRPVQQPPAQQQPTQPQGVQQTVTKAPVHRQAQQPPVHEPTVQRNAREAHEQTPTQREEHLCTRCAAPLRDTATRTVPQREQPQSSSTGANPTSPSPAFVKAMSLLDSVQGRFKIMGEMLKEKDEIEARIARRVLGPNNHLYPESSADEGASSIHESEREHPHDDTESETRGDQEKSNHAPAVLATITGQTPTSPVGVQTRAGSVEDEELDDDSWSHAGGYHSSTTTRRLSIKASQSPTSPVEGDSLADLLDGEELDDDNDEEEDEDEDEDDGDGGAEDNVEHVSPKATHPIFESSVDAGSSPQSLQSGINQGNDGVSDGKEQSSPQRAEPPHVRAVERLEEDWPGPQRMDVDDTSGDVSKGVEESKLRQTNRSPRSPLRAVGEQEENLPQSQQPKVNQGTSDYSEGDEEPESPHTPIQQIGLVREETPSCSDSSDDSDDADESDCSGDNDESSDDKRFFFARKAHLAYQKAASFWRGRPQQSDTEQGDRPDQPPPPTAGKRAGAELAGFKDSQYMVDDSDYVALAATMPNFLEPVYWRPEEQQASRGETSAGLAKAQSGDERSDDGTPIEQLDGCVETFKAIDDSQGEQARERKDGNEELKILQSDQFVDKEEEAEMSKDAENFARKPKERAKEQQPPPVDLKALSGAQSFIGPAEVAATSRNLDVFVNQSKAEKQIRDDVSAGLRAAVEAQFDVDEELLARTDRENESFARKAKQRVMGKNKAQADLKAGLKAAQDDQFGVGSKEQQGHDEASKDFISKSEVERSSRANLNAVIKAAHGDQFGVDSEEEKDHIDSINEDVAKQQRATNDLDAGLKAAHEDQFGVGSDEEKEHIDSSLAFAKEKDVQADRKTRKHRKSFLVWDDEAGREVEHFFDEDEARRTAAASDVLRGASDAQYFGEEHGEGAEEETSSDKNAADDTAKDPTAASSTYADALKASIGPDKQAQDETTEEEDASPTHTDSGLGPNAEGEHAAAAAATSTAGDVDTIVSPASDHTGLEYVPTGRLGVAVYRKARTDSEFSAGD